MTCSELDTHKDRASQALNEALKLEKFPLFKGDLNDFDTARRVAAILQKTKDATIREEFIRFRIIHRNNHALNPCDTNGSERII